MFSDGYKYWLAYTKNKISYYRCSRHNTAKCTARCIVENGRIRTVNTHCHEPEPDQLLVDQFRKCLTKRASTESTNLNTIYWEEASQRHIDAALLYTFASAESTMRKARQQKQQPLIVPETAEVLAEMLPDSPLFKIHISGSASSPQQFFQKTLTTDSGTCLVFVHLNTLQGIDKVEELHVDGSLTVSPNYHLMSFHSINSAINTSIVFAFVTERSQSMYASIFSFICEQYSAYICPNTIFTSLDEDIRTAAVQTFPEATIKTFWNDYSNNVLRQIKNDQSLRRQTSRGHGLSCLRMILVLPLLPADYISPGLDALRKWANDKKILSPELTTLFTHIVSKWIRSVGPHKISIFGLPQSMHNHVQHFNKKLKEALSTGANQFTIGKALEVITHIATKTYARVKKQLRKQISETKNDVGGQKKETNQVGTKKSIQIRLDIINDATQQWIRTPVHLRSPLHFLQLSSHCIDDSILNTILDGNETIISQIPHQTNTQTDVKKQSSEKPHFKEITSVSSSPAIILPDHSYSFELGDNTTQSIIPSSINNNHQQTHNIQIVSAVSNTDSIVHISSKPSQALSPFKRKYTDPPPLVFFSKARKVNVVKRALGPPPLVPIEFSSQKLKKTSINK